MAIAGAIITVFGFFISLSIVGAIIGIPMMMIGGVMMMAGMFRRKNVITNVVQVTNVPGQQSWPPQDSDVHQHALPRTSRSISTEPSKMITVEPSHSAGPANAHGFAYDRNKWAALVEYDEDISRVVRALQPFGQKYVDELATAYMAINDKEYLPMICKKIVANAQKERGENVAAIRPVRA